MFPKKTVCSGFPLFTSGSHHEEGKLVNNTTWELRAGGDRGNWGNSLHEKVNRQRTDTKSVRKKKKGKRIW